MIKYNFVEVVDCGFHYNIKNILANTVDFGTDTNKENFLPLSTVAHRMIKEALNNNQSVKIKKPIMANEVLPFDLIITDETDNIKVIQNSALINAKSLITPEITKESGYTMYEFMVYHDEMQEAGYIITDKNREEKYMEIIETDDNDLIELLEKYLECKDKIARGFFIKKRYDQLVVDMKRTKDKESIDLLYNNFIDKAFNLN